MQTEATTQHRWLQQLVGDWTMEGECVMGPDQPPEKSRGEERMRTLGDLWVLGEGTGEMPGGGKGQMLMTLGYDPAKSQFVGSWVGSMMANIFFYAGQLDAAGKVLTLDTEGQSFTGTGTSRYQDIIEIVDADHRTLSSQVLGADGKWTRFMTATYTRKK